MDEDLNFVDDSECIAFILKNIDPAFNTTDDEVQYIIDLICEYYVDTEMIEDKAETAEIAEDDMLSYIMAAVRKEKVFDLAEDKVAAILDQEYAYGKKTGMYE